MCKLLVLLRQTMALSTVFNFIIIKGKLELERTSEKKHFNNELNDGKAAIKRRG